jgi:uncharacterized repeat protein (TIGR03803 family)
MDHAGNLYGTTYTGGNRGGAGTVFKLKHAGSGWVFTPLYAFGQPPDGSFPLAPVAIAPNGKLYGTTAEGGEDDGTAFSLQPKPTFSVSVIAPWTEMTVFDFSYNTGNYPESSLVFDAEGNIYGTTNSNSSCSYGTVYQLAYSEGTWSENTLHCFSGTEDGQNPVSGVVFDFAGSLYGTTGAGGTNDYGTVYQLTPSQSGWTETIIHNFSGADGENPIGDLMFDSAGNLYGTTSNGLRNSGTVFEISPGTNGNWTFQVLYSFPRNLYGVGPLGGVTMGSSGALYGTTNGGGEYLDGAVYMLTPSVDGWTYTSLHDFTGGSDGSLPYGNVVFDTIGNLYGTASRGGTDGLGTIWKVTP